MINLPQGSSTRPLLLSLLIPILLKTTVFSVLPKDTPCVCSKFKEMSREDKMSVLKMLNSLRNSVAQLAKTELSIVSDYI